MPLFPRFESVMAETEPGPNGEPAPSRLDQIVQMMREMSQQTDPEEMVQAYVRRMKRLMPVDRLVSFSRRGLEWPFYKVTRSSTWPEAVNPWKQPEKLPLFRGGLVAEIIYGQSPLVIDDLNVDVDDPALEYLEGMRSVMALPSFDQGEPLNWSFIMLKTPHALDHETLADRVWIANLFGRATGNLVLKDELRKAMDVVERELRVVADIQRSLLPTEIPQIPGLSLAAHYQTSKWAGGDYYDFFPLADGRWGLLIADVSGHGTPAAVMMAITHAIAHGHPGSPEPPDQLLKHVNDRLTSRYMKDTGSFVTAFYAIYDPATRDFWYACAGHNPPRLLSCRRGTVQDLDGVGGLPLGIFTDQTYDCAHVTLHPGDQVVFYTDGITEAASPSGEMFGVARLDSALYQCRDNARDLVESVLSAVADFTRNAPAEDDRTLIVVKVVS
jgi:sigma-B regulation protein RsbU (phosphoserine phosphatase)